MAKDKLVDYDSTASGNLDVGGISVAEGMLPSNVNNAIREQMSHLKDFADGTEAINALAVDNLKMDGNTISSTDTNGDIILDPNGTGKVDINGNLDVDGGTIKLDGNYPVGTNNVALGDAALDDGSLSGGNNTAVGYNSATANTTGEYNSSFGASSLGTNSTGVRNTAIGTNALLSNTTGSYNVALGMQSLSTNTTASNNTAVGYQSLFANTTGSSNVAIGAEAADAITTGSNTTAIGFQAASSATTADDTVAIGRLAGSSITTGSTNVAIGEATLYYTTTGYSNTAIGRRAMFTNSTAAFSTVVGYQAGYTGNGNYQTILGANAGYYGTTAQSNTLVGYGAGNLLTTGNHNTFVGARNSAGTFSGQNVTTGSKNTILGGYDGNQGGLDIRTASNYIVLSDGDGNPRVIVDANGNIKVPATYNNTTGNAVNMVVEANGYFARSTSSLRYKNTINDATHGLTELLSLRPVTFKNNNNGDTIFGGLIAEEVHDAGLTEFVTYNDDGEPDALAYGNMVSLCIKAIQEQQETITALEARIAALESN